MKTEDIKAGTYIVAKINIPACDCDKIMVSIGSLGKIISYTHPLITVEWKSGYRTSMSVYEAVSHLKLLGDAVSKDSYNYLVKLEEIKGELVLLRTEVTKKYDDLVKQIDVIIQKVGKV